MNKFLSFLKIITIKTVVVSMLVLTSCSSFRAAPAPTTPFLIHAEKLHKSAGHAPWDLVWTSSPGHIMVQSPYTRKVYLAPIDTSYLNKKKDEKGNWVSKNDLSPDDVNSVTEALKTSFINEIKNHPETNLELVDSPGPGVIIIALSLTELVPTSISMNAVADVGGLLLPGSKIIENVGTAGAEAATGEFSGGSVAFEMKLIDSNTGQVLAEVQDREQDPTSVIPNYRDFEEFGWSRETTGEWAQQFREVFSTAANTVVDKEDLVSIEPW